jgi:hypothetical protein
MSTRKAKRPGLIEQPRDVLSVTRKKIMVESIIHNKPRKLYTIITIFDCKQSITINIGSAHIYSIDCTLMKNAVTGICETGTLTKARWDNECSLDEPFKKGDDSIIIIKFLLTYINDNYPMVTHLLFTDMSTKECDNGGSVNLAGMKILTDGKTWYESHFNIIMDEKFNTLYIAMKNEANAKKTAMTFETFMGYVPMNPIPINDMKLQYETSKTWIDFFSSIRNIIGVSQYCIWLSKNGWFDQFIRVVLKVNTMSLEFMFKPEKYDITYRTTNGGSRTRRFTQKLK